MPESRDDQSRSDEGEDCSVDKLPSESTSAAAPLPLPGLARAASGLLAAHIVGAGVSFVGLIVIGVWIKFGASIAADGTMSSRFWVLWTVLLVAPLALGAILAAPAIWRLTNPAGPEPGLLTARRLSRAGLLALPVIVVGTWLLAQPDALSRLWGGAKVPFATNGTVTAMTLAGAVLLLAVITHIGNLFRRLGRTESLGLVQFEYWLVLIACFVNLTNNELVYKIWVLRGLEAVAIIVGGVLISRLRRALQQHLAAYQDKVREQVLS